MYNNLKNLKLSYWNQLWWIIVIGVFNFINWKFEKVKFPENNIVKENEEYFEIFKFSKWNIQN
jgi:hypothetical protein